VGDAILRREVGSRKSFQRATNRVNTLGSRKHNYPALRHSYQILTMSNVVRVNKPHSVTIFDSHLSNVTIAIPREPGRRVCRNNGRPNEIKIESLTIE
jgi:hypothetical protein